MIELSKQQLEAYPHIKWLLSNNKLLYGTGRTFLMAYIFLEQAKETPNQWIRVFNHDGSRNNDWLIREIGIIANEEKIEGFEYNHITKAIRIKI